jgi:phosphomannomutase
MAASETIRFGTDGWRGVIGEDFTFANLRTVAQASARFMADHPTPGPKKILIGYDRRFLSQAFAETVGRIFRSAGHQPVMSCAPLPTSAVSACVKAQGASWGIMITASHNPALYNGYKIKDGAGRSAPPEVTQEIERLIVESVASSPPSASVGGPSIPTMMDSPPAAAGNDEKAGVSIFDFWPAYSRYLKERLDWNLLRRFRARIVFDHLYGVGAGIPEKLLSRTALHVHSLHTSHDPLFGGLHPEPIEPNLGALQKEVRMQRALVGIALDGDADRLGVVDGQGRYMTPHQVFPLLALHCIEHKGWRGKIVQAVSLGVLGQRIAEAYSLPFEEVPVGFKHVAERMLREDVLAGGEESGGYAVRGGLPERDGILSGLLFIEMLAARKKSPSQLLADMEKRFGRARFKRVDLKLDSPIPDKSGFAQGVSDRLPDRLAGSRIREVRTFDGIKIVLEDGAWVLLRPSGTEPLLRTYAESDNWSRTDRLLSWAHSVAREKTTCDAQV